MSTATAQKDQEAGEKKQLKLPTKLSPSRLKDYTECPRLFYERTILHKTTPPNAATTRGTLAHAVFERIFDQEPDDRTVEVALELVRPEWKTLTDITSESWFKARNARQYRDVFPEGSDAETELLTAAADVIRPWFDMERPWNFNPKDLPLGDGTRIDGRELHVEAPITQQLTVHGYIDRVDRWETEGREHWAISDYKTGKRIPGYDKNGNPYPSHTANRIVQDAFFAMRAYATLLHDQMGVTADRLRLIYVATGDRERGIPTVASTITDVDRTRRYLGDIYDRIVASWENEDWPCTNSFVCKDHDPISQ